MLQDLITKNTQRWNNVKVTSSQTELQHVVHSLVASKQRYQDVEKQTDVPWPIIAVIHEREASQSWKANLAQGDPWNHVSIHVPRGEGPFHSWEEAAIHALTTDDHLNKWSDWSIGGALTALEKFNGLGYYKHHIPSPYVWSKTNQYHSGKYIADGHFDPDVVDKQDGCAALLIYMIELDPTIKEDYKW